jgi:hypothetical protein
MRRAIILGLLTLSLVAPCSAASPGQNPPAGQRVFDRIVARIEDDILLESELRELGRYQQLLGEKPAAEDALLGLLIEQWIVAREAAAARFPKPEEAEVSRALEHIEKGFPSAGAYRARLAGLGLDADAVRRMVERQLLFARYVDYKFRPAAQVDAAAIEKYYREELVPQLAARSQAPPRLEAVEDQIRELLTQQQISERAARWLDDARSRLKVEIAGGKAGR